MKVQLFQQQVAKGDEVSIVLTKGENIQGTVSEIRAEYIRLTTAEGDVTILPEMMGGWKVLRSLGSSLYGIEQSPQAVILSDKVIGDQSPQLSPVSPEVMQKVIEIEVRFRENIANASLDLLPPNFLFPESGFRPKDRERVQKEWNRLRNQYEYAHKIKELSRLNQQLAAWRQLAEGFPFVSAIHFNIGGICGILGNQVDALRSFQLACSLSDSSENWYGLAATARQLKRDGLVCYALERYFQHVAPADMLSAWYVFVSHLPKFQNYRALAGVFEANVQKTASEQQIRLVLETGVYLLKSSGRYGHALEVLSEMIERPPEASHAVALLSSLLLDFPQVPTEEFQQVVASVAIPRVKPEGPRGTSLEIQPLGYVTSYFGSRGFGFIEASSGETYFFHVNSVEDNTLKADLDHYESGAKLPVWYVVRESPGHKYAQARNLIKFESPEDIIARAKTLANDRKFAMALAEIQKVSRFDPGNSSALELERKWQTIADLGRKPQIPLPRGKGSYHRAKQADNVEKNYGLAEQLYQQAIQEGDNKDSAVKDLAALLQKQTRHEEAIALLQQHRPNMQDKRAVDNIIATFYQHMGRHHDAVLVLQRLLESTPRRDKPSILKRIALSQFKSQEYEATEKTLRQVLSYWPTDVTAQRWLAALQEATASGIYSGADQVITAPDVLAEYASELSAFAAFHLDHCDFQGVDPSKVSGRQFAESDVDRLENFARKLSTRAPRERAGYYLSAAKILSIIQIDDNYSRFHDYLRRYFSSMGDGALADKRHPDVARAFYCESFAVSTGPRVWELEEPNIVLARYFFSLFEHTENLFDLKMLSVTETVKRLFGQHPGEERLFDAILHVSIFSRDAADRLLSAIYQTPSIKGQAIEFLKKRGVSQAQIASVGDHRDFMLLWQQLRQEVAQKQARRYAEFSYLRQIRIATDSLEDSMQQIDRLMQNSLFDLDRQRLVSLRQAVLTLYEFCRQSDFEEQERLSSVALAQCTTLKSEIVHSPTKLSLESILPVIEHLLLATEERFGEIMRTSRPEVEVTLPVESYTPNESSEIELQLSVSNSEGSSPAVAPVIIFEPQGNYFQMSPLQVPLKESLRGGAIKTTQIPLRVTKEAIKSQAFPITVQVNYRNRGGELQQSKKHNLTVRLYPAQGFEPIRNPYAAYAEGGPVIEREMFYGRDELISNLVHAILSTESRNKSVVIYGQKRAGKSSVLQHLKARLTFPVIPVLFSVQDIETELSYATFLYRILQRLGEVIEDEVYVGRPRIEFLLPQIQDFMSHPSILFHQIMSNFQRGCKRDDQWQDSRIMLLIDEFTDIYKETLRGNIPETFMKNWKALIEKQYFGAVLVGQDVMPKFKARFPNEFGVLQEERISYLAENHARRLIEEPIRIQSGTETGESRYRARAVSRILQLTAGSPFYIQIICNRLVEYMNQQKAKYVTDADVERVKNDLLAGVNSLQQDKFDNLLTAGDAALEEINPADTLAVCRAIAVGSQMGWCNLNAIKCRTATPVPDILKDLLDRDVVEKKGTEDYRLRVGLFREWLLTHQ